MRPQLENHTGMSTPGIAAVSPEKVATTAVAHYTASTGNTSESPGVEQLGNVCENAVQNFNQSEHREPGRSGPSINSTRLLRSRSKEKPTASQANNTVVTHDASEEKKRKRRKKKVSVGIAVNEFTKIKGRLRYVLSKMQYEQTLIEAYSGEGWKGQSLEKIKLEKELQRAKAHIFRYKLEIRDLFERIDTLLAQGRFPDSVFDDEGQIDSEDIFCAKCGSKDLPADDNDIILCDGACERGFHQLCVEPPLLKEDIPPDDEGWLCPGCDCKVDCIELLNDLQGTDLSVTDSWEKVYPKEAAAASGEKLDNLSGLPSDDSEDDDYNPDNPDVEKNDSGDESESSSDESDFYSASEDLGETPPKDDEILGLPSDDSEDDDYNPDAPDKDEPLKTESSSSDFTSDSEDLGLVVDTNRLAGDEEGVSTSLDNSRPNSDSQEKKAKVGRGTKRNSLKDELSSLMQSGGPLVSGKRHIERLDYKKLHDEEYGNDSSDSGDEDYQDGPLPKVRKIRGAKSAVASPSSTPADIQSETQKGSGHTSNRGFTEKLKVGGMDPSEPHSSGKKKTYGEGAIKRLYEFFKENQYPDRDTKEKLGKELGLTAHQVGKWFENARFAYRHSSRWDEIMNQKVSKESPSSPQIIVQNGVKTLGSPPNSCLAGEKSEGDLLIQEGSGKKSAKSKAKNDTTDQKLDDAASNKTSNAQVDSPNLLIQECSGKSSRKSKAKNGRTDKKLEDTFSNKTSDAQVDTPNLSIQEGSGKRPRKSKANNDTTDKKSDDTSSNKISKKQNVQVDTPNSKKRNVDTPNSKKRNAQVDTPKQNAQVDTTNLLIQEKQNVDTPNSKKRNAQVDTPNLLIQEGSGKRPRKSKANNDTTDKKLDGTPSNKTSKKQNALVDTPNSKKQNMQVDTPNSKKQNAQVDTPNSQNVRRSSRLQVKK